MATAQSEIILAKVANSVAIMTSYFRKAVEYPCVDVLKTADIVRPIMIHNVGEKCPRMDLSLSTTVLDTGSTTNKPRTSSPANPEDVDVVRIDTEGDANFL